MSSSAASPAPHRKSHEARAEEAGCPSGSAPAGGASASGGRTSRGSPGAGPCGLHAEPAPTSRPSRGHRGKAGVPNAPPLET